MHDLQDLFFVIKCHRVELFVVLLIALVVLNYFLEQISILFTVETHEILDVAVVKLPLFV